MIIKNFKLDKINIKKFNLFLFYGDNQGFKDEIVEKICQQKNLKKTLYFEKEVLSNTENFLNSISTKSFFENEKIIVIKNATDKLKEIINDIYELQNPDITVILISDLLEKKSKLRNFFEKTNTLFRIFIYTTK